MSTQQPFSISLKDEPLFACADLWASWHDPHADNKVETSTLMTTTPNALMAPIHDRMPVILQRHTKRPGSIPICRTRRSYTRF